MVKLEYSSKFDKFRDKHKRTRLKKVIKKLIIKIVRNPEVGKPMGGDKTGFREVYMKPFRFTYYYSEDRDIIKFLLIYHKDKQ